MGRIVVLFGMTASGKSTLARELGQRLGLAWFNTDHVRKELAGLDPTTRKPDGIGKGIYTPEMTRRTYEEMLARAARVLARDPGATVLLDGSYSSRKERDRTRQAARDLGAEIIFILCQCNRKETLRRLDLRARDRSAVSDGRPSIYEHQLRNFEGPDPSGEPDVRLLDSSPPLEELLPRVQDLLRVSRPA